jgi:hypothetical protein
LVTPPPVAVTVRIETPAAAVELAESVRTLLPLPGAGILVGAKLAVTPLGAPLTDKMMAELNPDPLAAVRVIVPDPPGATLALVALGVSVKMARTVRLRV